MRAFSSSTTTALFALLMASCTLAAPAPADMVEAKFNPLEGRAPAPTPAPSPDLVRREMDKWTVTFVNKHDGPITTRHARAAGDQFKDPISPAGEGHMESGESKEFEVPKDWNGSWFVNAKGKTAGATASQFEGNLMGGLWCFDVSYVKGFSLPMVCKCTNGVTSGCKTDLFSTGTQCPEMSEDACKNPNDADPATKFAVDFFKPCEHKAYTYVEDHEANKMNLCTDGHTTCCVGTACDE